MSRGNKLKRPASAYRRGKPRFEPAGSTFLVVTEGKKTEPNYYKALRQNLRLSSADVEIVHPPATDPVSLTEEAIKLRNARNSDARKGDGVVYDEVWVIFDLETTHDERRKLAAEAARIAKKESVNFAFSDPAFEYWLLLHFEYTTSAFEDCDAVINRLSLHWPGYAKGTVPVANLFKFLPDAIKRAQRCRMHHKTGGGDGKPSTNNDVLVERLNAATRPHLRLF